MNYIIEGGIDFYNEINNITPDNNNNTPNNDTLNNLCLITQEPLTINYIKS